MTAKLGFKSLIPATGTLVNTSLTATAYVSIEIKSVKVFGVTLGGGGTCRTESPSIINLRSTDTFDPYRGGTLLGKYSISDLAGCGPLTDLLSPLTAGSGNTVSVELNKI